MDKYDPSERIALMVDEWGTWYDVEPGTNPGFLYQQNTMRDAIVAAINLNIFNKYSHRVRMANLAQLVNVLQAVILTEGSSMVLTPTYHVFQMFGDHQDNMLLDSKVFASDTGLDDNIVPDVMESASINDNGDIVVTLCNLDANKEKTIQCEILGTVTKSIQAEVLTGNIDAHNTFDAPNRVEKSMLDNAQLTKDGFRLTMPACSVVKVIIS